MSSLEHLEDMLLCTDEQMSPVYETSLFLRMYRVFISL